MSKNLILLKQLFNEYQIDGYIIPSTDEFQSEYTAAYARRLHYITGFSGSNGIAIVLKNKTLFFTDGRYLAQAVRELDDAECEIYNLAQISEHVSSLVLGYDDMLFTANQLSYFANATLKTIETNLINAIWDGRPAFPVTDIYSYEIEYSGMDAGVKLNNIRHLMKNQGADYLLLTSSDSICWLLNIRASDVPFCPMLLSYLVLSQNEIFLFTEGNLNNKDIKIYPISQIKPFLSEIKTGIMVDRKRSPLGLVKLCRQIIPVEDPCVLAKACKQTSEIEGSKAVHIKDGVALCEALAWVEEAVQTDNLTEYDIGLKLTHYRSQQEGYVSDSFPAIVGFQENGAIIHYRAPEEGSKVIRGEGLLLIDSGGHYLGGTTDVTRTINIGNPTKEQKKRYTQVLKGHLNLAKQKFVIGTTGGNLDVIARMYLWQDEVDYAHGTGHGVGNMLSVHEGPQNISRYSNVALQKNMIISNEPGFYKSGSYGIRIENLQYVVDLENGFLKFESLTLVPYCLALIDYSLLEKSEIEFLRDYQERIKKHIYPKLTDRAKAWVDRNIVH